ncbi:peptidoglycan-binding protein [uncultured Sulfitobacter sp.]
MEVQRILREDGLYTGAFDGDFGPQTTRALRARVQN